MYQDFIIKLQTLELTNRLLVFDVDDFFSRLYTYEKDLLYNFFTPSFIGTGVRYFTLLKVKPIKGFTIRGKWSQTIYQNQDSVGSGYDELSGNKKSEFGIQLSLTY